jgi:hypothetical protein
MEDHWVFRLWILFSLLYHAHSLAVVLVPQTGLTSARRILAPTSLLVVGRRAPQSITCYVPTSRRPILHNNIFY